MRVLLQRVREARVEVGGRITGSIQNGLLIFLGIEESDNTEDCEWLLRKICAMRIFSDDEGKMNRDIRDVGGSLLIVSQFTLFASTKKGNRPSFIRAANPVKAIPLYEYFIRSASEAIDKPAATGQFGAMMDIYILNDGPVTIFMDSKNRE